MPSNIREFELALRAAEDEIPRVVSAFHRALLLEALRRVVMRSPVDKGRFRGNWQVTVGAPAATALEATDKSGGSTISRGAAIVSQVKGFDVSWLVNLLDYAKSLEEGHSGQAPAGVVAITIAELRQFANQWRPGP